MRGIIAISAVVASALAQQCTVSDGLKVDCGYVGINQQICQTKGCCWNPSSNQGVPWCYYGAGATTTCFKYNPAPSVPFSDAEVAEMKGYMMANINIMGKGGIVAAPDYNTPGGSYYFHWHRDAALTMRTVQETAANFSDVEATVKAYIGWVTTVMMEADPNSVDIRADPKFNLPNGDVFTGGWCRPQNDGPGLRAIALMLAANSLIAGGESSYVKQYLWTGSESSLNGGAIKYMLDYIVTANNWESTTCDLWEEIRDTDLFWNRFTMRKALILGAAFASQMGDSASAAAYSSTMNAINATLYSSHWTGSYIQETQQRTRDGAVIVGLNDGYDESDRLFAPTSFEVASTVNAYNSLFCSEYAINAADSANGIPGVLYGRYGGDTYAGGNPWILTTAALSSLFYRGAIDILQGNALPTASVSVWASAFNATSLPTGNPAALAAVFAAQGDGVLLRIRSHVLSVGLHLNEQLDRNTGTPMSAHDLTWSYAEVLNAMNWRAKYAAAAAAAVAAEQY